MKKVIYIFIGLCISMLSWKAAYAQPVSNYSFENYTGTYEEITDGTVVGIDLLGEDLNNTAFIGSATGVKELTTAEGFPIGFDFLYNDTLMNRFAIVSIGEIILGKDQVTVNPQNPFTLFADFEKGAFNVLGTATNMGVIGTETTEISYKSTGTVPNRVLTVQFKNLGIPLDYWGDIISSVNFQIRLYETTNKIEFIYKNWINSSDRSINVRVGLKGSLENDRHLRISETGNWTNTSKTVEAENLSWTKENNPADGLTYVFTPPTDCEKPTEQPTEMKLTSSSISIEGSFKATSTADHYLILMTEDSNLSMNPTDKVYYKAGAKIGNGIVIAYDTLTTFTTSQLENFYLEGAKTYYFHVFAVNSYCMFGPQYNTTAPLTAQVNTLAECPQGMEITEEGYTTCKLKVTGNKAGDKVIIAMTDIPLLSDYGTIMIDGSFGQPIGELNVGDELEKGGKIIYKGEAAENIQVNDLKENTLYHFKAWSMDKNGSYSTTSVTANLLTWGKIPYIPDFSKMPIYAPPFGWENEGEFSLANARSADGTDKIQLQCFINAADPTNGRLNTLTTPWILLNQGTHRLLLNYNMYIWGRFGNTPYNNWDERDALEIQVSNDGITYTTVYTFNKENAPKFPNAETFLPMSVEFNNFSGQKVKIRLSWKCYAAVRLTIENFMIEEKPECDYPVNVTVDPASLVGTNALIQWTPQGEENTWEIQYRKVGEETWQAPIEAKSNPYLLTTLPEKSKIQLQVRAKCSITNASPWSKAIQFTTGYSIPFSENFDAGELPLGWNLESGQISDSTEFCTSGFSCRKFWEIKDNSLVISYSRYPSDWAILPLIDLEDGSAHYNLEFDIKKEKIAEEPMSEDAYFAIVISTDGGKTFSTANIIKKWSLKEGNWNVLGENSHFSINLNDYTGKVRLAFYAEGRLGGGEQISLDNIGIIPTCPPAQNVKASEVTVESAKITWEGEASEWLVFARKAGETLKDYRKQTETELMLNELESKTTYEVGITKTCAVGDTAKVMVVSFTTLALDPCLPVTDIQITPSQQYATIS